MRASRPLVLAGLLLGSAAAALAAYATSTRPGSGDPWRTIQSQGQTWSYLFHRSTGTPAGVRVPLVVALHGAPDTPDAMAARTRFDTLADAHGFDVVYPSFPLTPGQEDTGPSKPEVVSDVIDSLVGDGTADPGRVFVTGFSGGAIMSYRIACLYAAKVSAIASVAGVMVRPDCAPARPVSVLEIHGTADGSIPYGGGQYTEPVRTTIDRWRTLDGCPATETQTGAGPVDTEAWRPCSAGTEVRLDTVATGVHAWPGDPRFPASSPDGQFDASEAIWAFFALHGRTVSPGAGAAEQPAVLAVRVVKAPAGTQVLVRVRVPSAGTLQAAVSRPGAPVAAASRAIAAGATSMRLAIPSGSASGSLAVRVVISLPGAPVFVASRSVRLP